MSTFSSAPWEAISKKKKEVKKNLKDLSGLFFFAQYHPERKKEEQYSGAYLNGRHAEMIKSLCHFVGSSPVIK
jgi:hypothetical protein